MPDLVDKVRFGVGRIVNAAGEDEVDMLFSIPLCDLVRLLWEMVEAIGRTDTSPALFVDLRDFEVGLVVFLLGMTLLAGNGTVGANKETILEEDGVAGLVSIVLGLGLGIR